MSVEKRYSKRLPLHGDVYIRYRKQRAFPAKAMDCSQYGMSLRTENLTLLNGAMVELDLIFNNRNWQITGLVTHTGRNALGVMFWDAQPELYRAVLDTLPVLANDRGLELNTQQSPIPYAGKSAQ
jgi:hypothetical protein